jgi:hypothetical protein
MLLSNILQEIETHKPNAEMDVTLGNPSTFGGRQGLKRAAMEAIKRLKHDYRTEFLRSSVFMIVVGPAQKAFADIASTETFGCFVSDPDSLFNDLVAGINPTLYGRESTKYLFNQVSNALETKCLELDISSYPSLTFNERYNRGVTCVEEFLPLVRNAVCDQVGSELVGLNASYSLVDRAIKNKHVAAYSPIVLSTSDEHFALDLQKNLRRLSKNVFYVIAGATAKGLLGVENVVVVKKVSEDTVADALTSIRNKIVN